VSDDVKRLLTEAIGKDGTLYDVLKRAQKCSHTDEDTFRQAFHIVDGYLLAMYHNDYDVHHPQIGKRLSKMITHILGV